MTQPEPNYKRHTARYRARRRAADILFEAESRDVDPVAIVEDRVALARDPENGVAPIAEYTRAIVSGAAEELDAIDEAIARYLSDEWSLERIPAVDRAIMRVSVWEILFNDEVPNATALVEGVELASEYSNHQAAPYIHAVLDDVIQAQSADSPMVSSAEVDAATGVDAAEDDDTAAEVPAEASEESSGSE